MMLGGSLFLLYFCASILDINLFLNRNELKNVGIKYLTDSL